MMLRQNSVLGGILIAVLALSARNLPAQDRVSETVHNLSASGPGQVIVATTNDDLPALALYQRYGFRVTEVIPGGVAAHHGGEFPGFAGIPVRDEIRLACGMGRLE